MSEWSVDNGDIAVGRFRITSGSPRELVEWHNRDIDALTAERDEWKRRCEAILGYVDGCIGVNGRPSVAICQSIAEGRDNG